MSVFLRMMHMLHASNARRIAYTFPFDISESSYFESVTPNPLVLYHEVVETDELEFTVTFFEDIPAEELAKKEWEIFAVDVDEYGHETRVYGDTMRCTVDVPTGKMVITGISGWQNTMKFYCVDNMAPSGSGSSGGGDSPFDPGSPTTVIGNTEWTRFDLDYHDNALWYGTEKLMNVSDPTGIYRTDEAYHYLGDSRYEVVHDGSPVTALTLAAVKRLLLDSSNPLPGGWRVPRMGDWINLYKDGFGYTYSGSRNISGAEKLFTYNGMDNHCESAYFPNRDVGEETWCKRDLFDSSATLKDDYQGITRPGRDRLHLSFKDSTLIWAYTGNAVSGGHADVRPMKAEPTVSGTVPDNATVLRYFVSAMDLSDADVAKTQTGPWANDTNTVYANFTPESNGLVTFYGDSQQKTPGGSNGDLNHVYFAAEVNYYLDWTVDIRTYEHSVTDTNGVTTVYDTVDVLHEDDISQDRALFSIRLCRDAS